MSLFETVLVWGGIYLYAAISVLLLTAFVFNKEKLLGWAGRLLVPGFVAHTLEFGLRWVRTGYFPGNGDYENALVGTWFIIAFTLYIFARKPGVRGAAVITVPGTLLFLGIGIMRDPLPLPVSASFKSFWLPVHVLFAQISYGAYAIACALGVLYLLKERSERKGSVGAVLLRVPRLSVVDELMFKFVIYGFVTDAIMIAAGAIWAKELWGAYWSWDPVEVWSLISWLTYGMVIHLRVTMGWQGKRLAWILVFAIVTVIVVYWGVDFVVEGSHRAFGVDRP